MDSGERSWNLNHKSLGQKAGQVGAREDWGKKVEGEKETTSF